MIIPAILYTVKGKLWLGLSAVFTTIAITEVFLGQIIGALIAATPPTIAIIFMAKKQSEERRIAQAALLKGQAKMAEDLDGKLDRLSNAETGRAKAEGIIEGGDKERASVAAAVPTEPAQIEIVNKKENPVPTIQAAEPKLEE